MEIDDMSTDTIKTYLQRREEKESKPPRVVWRKGTILKQIDCVFGDDSETVVVTKDFDSDNDIEIFHQHLNNSYTYNADYIYRGRAIFELILDVDKIDFK